jgi:hypothetical protein
LRGALVRAGPMRYSSDVRSFAYVLLFAAGPVAACGLELVAASDSFEADAGPGPKPTGSMTATEMPDASPPFVDGGPTLADGGPAPLCGPGDSNLASPLEVHRAKVDAGGIRIDGVADDWQGAEWHSIDKRFGPLNGTEPAPACAQFAVVWDTDNVYAALRVVDAAPPSTRELLNIWDNDAVEFFWGKKNPGNGLYTPDEHQLVVDRYGTGFHKLGVTGSAALNTVPFAPTTAIAFSLQRTGWGYVAEARWSASTVSQARFDKNETISFNAAFDNGRRSADGGIVEKDYHYWQLDRNKTLSCPNPDYGCCAGLVGNSVAAYCNTGMFAQIKFVD